MIGTSAYVSNNFSRDFFLIFSFEFLLIIVKSSLNIFFDKSSAFFILEDLAFTISNFKKMNLYKINYQVNKKIFGLIVCYLFAYLFSIFPLINKSFAYCFKLIKIIQNVALIRYYN